jgi:hypothetical protein
MCVGSHVGILERIMGQMVRFVAIKPRFGAQQLSMARKALAG